MDRVQIGAFLGLAQYAIKVAESDASWATKYKIIFDDDVSVALRQMVSFDYCQMGSYEDCVMSFINALKCQVEEFEKATANIM